MRNAFRLMVLALVATPAFIPAQKIKVEDELVNIERDILGADEKMKSLLTAQVAQDKKIEDLRVMLQQQATAASQVSQDMVSLQKSLTAALAAATAEQQTKVSQALVPFGSRVDGVATSVDQLNTTIAAMSDRIARLEGKLKNIDDKVSLINQPAPALPPPAPGASAPPEAPANGVPPGVTKLGVQQDAQGDFIAGKNDLALNELTNYIKWWPTDAWAPTAGTVIGQIYMRTKDYESASQAFQSVIDNYPGINEAQNALYQKGMALALWPGHKTEAVQALRDFVSMYPVNENVRSANEEIKKLTAPSAAQKQNKKAPGAKQP